MYKSDIGGIGASSGAGQYGTSAPAPNAPLLCSPPNMNQSAKRLIRAGSGSFRVLADQLQGQSYRCFGSVDDIPHTMNAPPRRLITKSRVPNVPSYSQSSHPTVPLRNQYIDMNKSSALMYRSVPMIEGVSGVPILSHTGPSKLTYQPPIQQNIPNISLNNGRNIYLPNLYSSNVLSNNSNYDSNNISNNQVYVPTINAPNIARSIHPTVRKEGILEYMDCTGNSPNSTRAKLCKLKKNLVHNSIDSSLGIWQALKGNNGARLKSATRRHSSAAPFSRTKELYVYGENNSFSVSNTCSAFDLNTDSNILRDSDYIQEPSNVMDTTPVFDMGTPSSKHAQTPTMSESFTHTFTMPTSDLYFEKNHTFKQNNPSYDTAIESEFFPLDNTDISENNTDNNNNNIAENAVENQRKSIYKDNWSLKCARNHADTIPEQKLAQLHELQERQLQQLRQLKNLSKQPSISDLHRMPNKARRRRRETGVASPAPQMASRNPTLLHSQNPHAAFNFNLQTTNAYNSSKITRYLPQPCVSPKKKI